MIIMAEPKDGNLKQKDEVLKIEVDRSKIEKDQQDELEKRAIEIETLQRELKERKDKMTEMEGKSQEESEKYENLETEFNDTKSKLQELATAKFDEEKEKILKAVKEGLTEEKFNELKESIKSPRDLQNITFMLGMMEEVNKSQAERDAAEGGNGSNNEGNNNGEREGNDNSQDNPTKVVDFDKETVIPTTGGDPQKPPKSVVRKPGQPDKSWIFQTTREGIDALYAETAKGNKEAEKVLNQYREKAWNFLKKNYNQFQMAITECPVCGAGILVGEKCPFCSFDPVMWRATGGEMF